MVSIAEGDTFNTAITIDPTTLSFSSFQSSMKQPMTTILVDHSIPGFALARVYETETVSMPARLRAGLSSFSALVADSIAESAEITRAHSPGDADERGDLLAVEPTQLGQLGDGVAASQGDRP